MKKYMSMVAVIFCSLFLMGADSNGCDSQNKKFEEATGAVSDVQAEDQEATALAFGKLRKAVPPPMMKDSQERRNLSKRLTRFNVANKISYIYLLDRGHVMAFYTVKGKVSSVNSMLTVTQQLVDDGQGRYNGRGNVHVVDSPDLDGSYGSNGDAIFFFTTEDVYVEWNGTYLLSDQPLKINKPVLMVQKIK